MKRLILILVVALLAAVPASASTFVGLSHSDLVRQADAVVIGKVIDRVSAWTDSGRLIYTDNMVLVEQTVLGDVPSTVMVRTFGGQVGDVIVEAHGFPKFEDGEDVLLFLQNDAEVGALRVLGFQQGHFRVVERLDGVTLAVPQVDEGARLLDRRGRPVAEPVSVRLEQFEARILRTAAQVGRAIEK